MNIPLDYHALPKVDLHRHLEGSLRLETMLDIARAHQITIPANIVHLSNLVQVQNGEPFTYQNFLAKFATLRMFYRSPEVIHRVTMEAVEDAARDNVRYLELRFTPVALSRAERFPLAAVTDWVCDAARQASKKYGLTVRLIASVNRHESIELAEQVAWTAVDHLDHGLVGLDLAGNEAEFPAAPFVGLFREARQAGLEATIHAGEWGQPANIRQAIEEFGVRRIGHGVRVLEDEYTTALARERGVVFEICVTSNYQSGVVPSLEAHPLPRMLSAGLAITLNTDDPSISQITLSDEYRQACERLGLSPEALKYRILAAAEAGFLKEDERRALTTKLRKELGL